MVKEFYDRVNELAGLREMYDNLKVGRLVAIYGRRRVGKTDLVREFMEKIHGRKLYFYVDLAARSNILDSLSNAIQEQLNETFKFTDFNQFFAYLKEKSEKDKFLIAIDEFQRFLDIAPDFITKLQNMWDSSLKDNKIMFLLIGSSIGMIQKITGSRAGALYGRAAKFKISPFRYVDFRLMFKNLKEHEKVTAFAVFGGTPHYLNKFKLCNSNILSAISDLVLKKGGDLVEEPKTLLEIENVRTHAQYNSILQAIASGKDVLKEIQDFTKIPATAIPAYIIRLDVLLDLVSRQDPILGKERSGKYIIRDNFFKFWYKFIFPNQTALNLGNTKLVLDAIKENLDSYTGKIFENVVRELLILYLNKKIKGFDINFEDIGGWWDRSGNEIDIVAYNEKAKTILAGEVKWTSSPTDIAVLDDLIRKAQLIGVGGKYNYVLVSKSGFTDRCIKKMKELGVLYLDLDDMSALFDAA